MASGCSLHHFTRPRFSCAISPARVRIVRCLEIAASDISKGSATSVTAMSSSNNMVRIDRRVGSARAAKTVSSSLVIGCTLGVGTHKGKSRKTRGQGLRVYPSPDVLFGCKPNEDFKGLTHRNSKSTSWLNMGFSLDRSPQPGRQKRAAGPIERFSA